MENNTKTQELTQNIEYSKAEVMDAISSTSIQMIISDKYKFYFYVLNTLRKKITDAIPTAGVGLIGAETDDISDLNVMLAVNPNFYMNLNDRQRIGVLVHELLHVVNRHIITYSAYPDKELHNIAADMCINQYIDKQDLPEAGVFVDDYINKGLPLERYETTNYYYYMLKDLEEKHERGGSGGSLKDINTNEAYEHHKRYRSEELHIHKSHDGWKLTDKYGNELSEAQRKAIEEIIGSNINEIIKDAKNMGIVPAGLDVLLDELYKPAPDFAWKRMIRLFANNSKKTKIKTTMKKRSKRYGTIPGIKIQRKQHLMVAVDTSGSVSDSELSNFFAEIYHIYRAGVTITIVECDAAISKVWEYRGKAPKTISGRGGTDFNEPIELAKKLKPDGLIYFTDGECYPPKEDPNCRTMWVVTSNGASLESMKEEGFKGLMAKMNE